MKISNLNPNPENPRKITDEKLVLLKNALLEFGDLGGFVYNQKTKRLVGGHQRAKLFDKNAEVTIEKKYPKPTATGTVAEGYAVFNGERFKYREVNWDEIKEKAANIAANKGAGEWDIPQLSEWLKDIDAFGFDLDLTMFDESERAGMLEAPAEAKQGLTPDDEIPEKVAPKTKLGEVWTLGEHRLMCGDSTKDELLLRLFQKQKVDITFSSPPYNANTKQMVNGKAGNLYNDYTDDLSSEDYVEFASSVLSVCIDNTKEYVFWNVNYNSNSRAEFIKQILPHLDLLDETIAWKKTALPVPHGLTRTWEPIFVFKCHGDKKRLGHENVTEFNYWDVNNAGSLSESHRAAFPVALPLKAIELVKGAKTIFDPFGGSGTTLIAAEKMGLKCFMMELDPHYCDVVIARWEKFTGQKAKLVKK